MNNIRIKLLILLTILSVFLIVCSCTGNNQDDTDDAITTAPVTTDATETEEPEVVVDPNRITFDENLVNSDYFTVVRADYEIVPGDTAGNTMIKLSPVEQADKTRSAVQINYAGYMRAYGSEPLSTDRCLYLVIKLMAENASSDTLYIQFTSDGTSKNLKVPAAKYDTESTEWQYMFFDLSGEKWNGNVKSIQIDFSSQTKNYDEILYIESISMMSDINSVLGAYGMPEEQLGYGSSLVLCDNDPIIHEKITAPDDDDTVLLWFDRTTEKTAQATFTPGNRVGYTIRMAKNEIEDCQFFIAPQTDRSFRVELSDFTDKDGNKLSTSLFFDYYHNVNGVMIPDAIPPVQGAIAVKGGQSQGFLIKAKTTAKTVAGIYCADVNVYDDATGKCIKTAKVYTQVWNFALSDETEMRTSMQMLNWKTFHTYPGEKDTDMLAINYYEFLLDNRICAAELPFGVRDTRSAPYLDNPRVNSFLIPAVEADRHADYTASVYDIMSSVPGRLEKTYFYRFDEPVSLANLKSIANIGDSLTPYYPDYRMVSPFYVNIDCGNKDMIEYMKPYIKIWCVKMNAFTPRKFNFMSNMWYLQSQKQDNKYGEFTERMEKEKAEGDEVWAYFCFEPLKPYANWMAVCDGTEPEITFWQCKLLGITGTLIWGVNAWTDDMYGNIKSHDAGASWGDGILIYSGAPYGINTPVSSLRLESIRDGIEDYQMLCMLEELCGTEAAEEYIRMITTSVVNFTSDDDRLATVRTMLGERLEQELNK